MLTQWSSEITCWIFNQNQYVFNSYLYFIFHSKSILPLKMAFFGKVVIF